MRRFTATVGEVNQQFQMEKDELFLDFYVLRTRMLCVIERKLNAG